MSASLKRISTEYVWHRITTNDTLIPSENDVEVAFMPNGSNDLPQEEDWNEADLIEENDVYWVRILVGPDHVDAIELDPGTYRTYVRLKDNPETIVRATGNLSII